MTVQDRDDAILVKIKTIKDDGEKDIASYYTSAFDETLKMFITAQKYQIECGFNEYSTVVSKEYKEMLTYIRQVIVNFGSEEDLPTIEVYV